MGKIKELLQWLFPMSAKSADRRITGLENSLENIAETHDRRITGLENSLESIAKAQKELAEKLERMEDAADRTGHLTESILKSVEKITGTLDAWCQVRYPKLMTFLDGLAEQAEQGRSVQAETNSRLQDTERQIVSCLEILDSLKRDAQEMVRGDVFRRIEFTQGKLVWIESLLQRNMLSQESQKNSAEYRFILRMRALFPLMEVRSDKRYVRIGRHNDGGYVMLDDFEGRTAAYSIGIADDVSWDRDIASRGLDVYMYDHTIDGLPEENERFHFSCTGIGTQNDASNPSLKTLPEMMAENGHMDTYGMILKIDVEGAEWAVLQELDEEILKHFSQIVFEFHGLTDMKNEMIIRPAMEKLNKTHQLVHLHANNYGSYRLLGGAILPELLEGTYLLRDEYSFGERPERQSGELDEINCPYLADICLGKWNA